MALKKTLTSELFTALAAPLQALYIKGENGYTLDVEGGLEGEDVGPLKRAKEHEARARKEAETRATELQTQLATLTEERDGLLKGAIPKADVERLETSYKNKLAARETELTKQIETLNGSLTRSMVDSVASSLASEISTAPSLILPHIKARLKADISEGNPVTRVLDAEGKLSALTVEDLKKEFIANKDFSAIISGSKGSGSGASGSGKGGGAPSTKIDFTKASPKDIVATFKARGDMPTA